MLLFYKVSVRSKKLDIAKKTLFVIARKENNDSLIEVRGSVTNSLRVLH